ncbi:hypothetical protein HMPREF1978_01511 [Actinomyces graevenitzii F0530]|uniref:Uncharacterized protein n=1 Tax=Actinomyces graevenitzii F0530 TaxID=1321817 RepID=U1R508_9ACTO|nr:hypothetical protein HMPREF1978_01511 [Actinomyces graevenitzii F0530]
MHTADPRHHQPDAVDPRSHPAHNQPVAKAPPSSSTTKLRPHLKFSGLSK